ncbi:MAG: hypothetical protein ABEK17_02110 [Candidatus Aenigmatarchaeota archaeon]
MPLNFMGLLVNVIASVIVISPSIWLAGKIITNGGKASFFGAVGIVILGTVLGNLVGFLFSGIAASLITFIIWLGLIRSSFKTSWGSALAISILSVIIFVAIGFITGLLGLGVWIWMI